MADEFQESDVIFAGPAANHKADCSDSRTNKFKVKRKKVRSAPVDIPENSWFRYVDPGLFDGDDGGEMVPPHVVVGRRVAGEMAFSVCSGNGRTLKGRDLSEMRNSVLRMTGFLET